MGYLKSRHGCWRVAQLGTLRHVEDVVTRNEVDGGVLRYAKRCREHVRCSRRLSLSIKWCSVPAARSTISSTEEPYSSGTTTCASAFTSS